LPQPRKRAPPMRIRLIAVTWPHDMIRRELSSNHACQMQGRPTGYFLSEHVHACEIFPKSRTRERARPGSARIGKVGPFRTVSPFVRGAPDHSNNVQTGRRDWGVIRTSRSHWLARTCARRARVVMDKTDPEQRCLLSEHPLKMHVTLLSIFCRVKMVLSFCKSRVFSRTRFQFPSMHRRLYSAL